MSESVVSESVLKKIRSLSALEKVRLRLLLGRDPSKEELHLALQDACLAWCESWFSPQEKALSKENQQQLAFSWLAQTGVLSTLDFAEAL